MIRVERRLGTPRWLSLAVPAGSLVLAAVIVGIVLAATGHNPLTTYKQIYHAAFTSRGALSATFIYATPLLFTGLCAAVAQFTRLNVLGLKNVPIIGPILFQQDAMVYMSWALVLVAAWYL